MYRLTLTAVVLMLVLAISSPAATWKLDKAHSSIGFSVRHMVISKTTGTFGEFDGTVEFDGVNFETGSVEVTAQMASVDTDNAKRDDHLKSADFFEVEKYPTMTFKSTKVKSTGKDSFELTGMLTIKGISREVTFDSEFNGAVSDPMGNRRAGFSAETEIDRQDFNVSFSKVLDSGGLVVGDMVKLMLELEVIKTNEQVSAGN